MKQFPVRLITPDAPFGTVPTITQVIGGDGSGTMNVNDIRERIHILDAVEGHKDGIVTMDDKLHKKLCELVSTFKFAYAHRSLMVVLDDILGAEAAPKDLPEKPGPV